jgi:hypothetical protein
MRVHYNTGGGGLIRRGNSMLQKEIGKHNAIKGDTWKLRIEPGQKREGEEKHLLEEKT